MKCNNQLLNSYVLKTEENYTDKNIQTFIKKNLNYSNETQRFFSENQNLTARLRTEENEDEKFGSTDHLTHVLKTSRSIPANSLSTLKKKISDLNHSIILDNRSLSQFPIHYYRYMNQTVKILDLRNNNIKTLPDEISNFSNLEMIKLDNNSLHALPDKFFTHLTPKFVSISNNYLKVIPPEISNWEKSIEYLNFSINFIPNLPLEISQLKNLKSLHLNNNSFVAIPKDIHKLNNLKELGLEWFRYVISNIKDAIINISIHKRLFAFFKLFLSQQKEEFLELKIFLSAFPQAYHNGKNFNIQISPPEKMIFEACFNEDLGVVRFLISEYPEKSLNFINEEGYSPLSYAIHEEKYLSAKLLIQSGCNVNIGGGEYGCPLNLGITRLQFYLVKDLIKYGGNPNLESKNGDHSLNFLFQEWDNPQPIFQKIFNFLMENSAFPNKKNELGYCPLHIVLAKKLKEPLKAIIKYNQNFSDKSKIFDFKKKTTNQKQTCLHLAAIGDDTEAIWEILQQKECAEQLFERDIDGNRPIHLSKQNYTSIKILRKFEKEYLKRFLPSNKKKNFGKINASINFDEDINFEEESTNLTTKMNDINFLNIKGNNFSLINSHCLLSKNPLKLKSNNSTTSKVSFQKLKMKNEKEENDSSMDSLKADFDEDSNHLFEGGLTQWSQRKFNLKKLPISPNNIRKIERIQKYSNYFTKNQTKPPNANSFRKLDLDTLQIDKDIKIDPNIFLFNVYKKVVQKFEKYKKLIEEFHEEIISYKNILSMRLNFLFLLFRIQQKILKIANELINKRISLSIINVNFFESSQLNEEEIKFISKNSNLQKFHMVFYELINIFQNLDNKNDENYNIFFMKYEIVTFLSFYNSSQFLKELSKEKFKGMLKYEYILGIFNSK